MPPHPILSIEDNPTYSPIKIKSLPQLVSLLLIRQLIRNKLPHLPRNLLPLLRHSHNLLPLPFHHFPLLLRHFFRFANPQTLKSSLYSILLRLERVHVFDQVAGAQRAVERGECSA